MMKHRSFLHGVVALNNFGVTLLQQGNYRQAKEVFCDAIVVLKTVLQLIEAQEKKGVEPFREDTKYSSCVDIDGKLRKALLHTLGGTETPSLGEVIKSEVLVHSLNGMLKTHGKSLLEQQDHNSIIVKVAPIRIEVDPSLDLSEKAIDLETAIVLYNLGLTYTFLAHSGTQEDTIHKIKVSAVSMFLKSQIILQRLLESSDAERADLTYLGGVLQTEGLVLEAMYPLIHELAHRYKKEKVLQLSERLDFIFEAIDEIAGTVNLLYKGIVSSAAAA
jgi:hypothetical protein